MSFDVRRGTGKVGLLLLVLASGCVSSASSERGAGSAAAVEPVREADGRKGELDDQDFDLPVGDERIALPQHTKWTIQRGATQTFRVVAYGDSIFAGFQRSIAQVAKRAAPLVAGEYLAHSWDANVEVVRRALSGAVASEVYNLMQTDKAYMADPSTRAVYFEMCGNDYLAARKTVQGQSGQCNFADVDTALQACVTNMDKAMQFINATATTATRKAIANLYYPGFDADNVASHCTDATGATINIREMLLPYMARSNYQACTIAKRNGFACVDSFAEFMAADYDTNQDGIADDIALRYDPSETEAQYVQRITVTLRSTIRDSNLHGLVPGTTADYMFTDDIHPTYYLGTISVTGGGTGQGPPDFSDADLASGKNPKWNLFGHERMGWALWQAAP